MERVYEDIEKMLCKELEEIGRKGELTTNNLDVMYRSVDVIKDIYTIDAMKHSGYSNAYPDDYSERYMRPMYSYDERPHTEHHDTMGGYSRDEADLRAMMDRATDMHEKEVLRKALDSMRHR